MASFVPCTPTGPSHVRVSLATAQCPACRTLRQYAASPNGRHSMINPVSHMSHSQSSSSSSSSSGSASYSRHDFLRLALFSSAFALPLISCPPDAAHAARPEGVNRPELLPDYDTSVIDLERFLASGEVRRLRDKISDVEKRTGFKIRLLTQRFPQTPGLAVRDYWGVDDNTVVIVADYFGGNGQLLKFNVGLQVDQILPPRFWSVLSSKFGNTFYVKKNGEAAAIVGAVDTIRYCLLQGGCAAPPQDIDSIF